MKINTLQNNTKDHLLEDLKYLLSRPLKRPCDGCVKPCSCAKNSPECPCSCSLDCPIAATMLTSDRNFPIEDKVLSMVLALKNLQTVQPCWSCEGHLDGKGDLFRAPQVWFYTDSLLYPQLIGEVIQQQKIRKQLHYFWELKLTTINRWDTAFILTPAFDKKLDLNLEIMQKDMKEIAEHLVDNTRNLAIEWLKEIKSHH